jgi:tetratricopeptide (TPR) repeat protein
MRFTTCLLLAAALPLSAQTLDKGLGELHWPVSTKDQKAQAFFDQGMKYVYAFNHEKAVSSFNEASKLDPELAIAYWGAALALGPNINLDVDPDREKQAYDAIHQAEAHLKHSSDKERALIYALANRYSNDPKADLKKLAVTYSRAMASLSKKYPLDDNIATLYAESLMDLNPWKFWSASGKPAKDTETIVRTLERVIRRNPTHIGANHYYIHAIEGSPHPEIALQSAKRLETLAPAAGHLVHMPAHIYQRTGNYAGAAKANENAADVDREFIKANGANGIYPMMYYNHNLQFGAASFAMIGDYDKALKMATEVATNAAEMVKEMPPIEVAASYPLQIMVRFGKWKEIVEAKPVTAGPLSIVIDHYARGAALAALKDISGAQSELKALDKARENLGTDPGIMQNSPADLGAIASQLLAGRIAGAFGDHNQAATLIARAVNFEDVLGYDEPPDWWLPTRETLGAELLRAQSFTGAEKAFRQDLQRNPNNPRSLFGLAEALKGQERKEKDAEAKTVMKEFQAMWKGTPLTLASY